MQRVTGSCVEFTVTFGVEPGYFFDTGVNESISLRIEVGRVKKVALLWQTAMEVIFASTGISVGGVVAASTTVYDRQHGCPSGGELTVTVTGSSNPAFTNCYDDTQRLAFIDALVLVVENVKSELNQTTVRLITHNAACMYFKPKE